MLDSGCPNYTVLFKLYIFGDKIKDDGFCDHVVSVVCRGLDQTNSEGAVWSPAPEVIKVLYERTLPSCPLRDLVARDHAERFDETWFDDSVGGRYADCPKEFFMDMTKEFVKLRGKSKVQDWYDRREQFFKQKGDVPEEKEEKKGNAAVRPPSG